MHLGELELNDLVLDDGLAVRRRGLDVLHGHFNRSLADPQRIGCKLKIAEAAAARLDGIESGGDMGERF